jgi:hypothetical protein
VSGAARWPNLFLVGAAKAGTTSLWRYLAAHPEVFMAPVKEPHFFSGQGTRLYPAIRDDHAYLRLFERARTRLLGEASPSYLWHEPAAARIKEASPDAKILISLRDPVERAYATYWHSLRLGLERESFAAAVARHVSSRSEAAAPYVSRSQYTRDVARYLRLFGPNVHVVVVEKLARDARRELAAIFAFLGVDPAFAGRIDTRPHNAFVRPRGRLASALLASERVRLTGQRLVPRALRWPIERTLLERGPKPALDPETDALLTDFFRSDVLALARLLGRALPWPRWPETAAAVEGIPRKQAAG